MVAGEREVECERICHELRMRVRGALDRGRRPQVELSAATEWEALVGHVAEHRVPKCDAVRPLAFEDRIEIRAERLVELDPIVSEKIGEYGRAKAATENGRGPHEAARYGGEPVELDAHRRVEGVRQGADEAGRSTHSEQLAEKERAPSPRSTIASISWGHSGAASVAT